MLTIRFSNPIAAAVAGEITRIAEHPGQSQCEGAAYKAAFDRLGSSALIHCETFRRDCLKVDACEAIRAAGMRPGEFTLLQDRGRP